MKQLLNPWSDLEAYSCYGCCPTNPMGCQMTFYEDGDDIVSVWKPTPHHQSWINTLHGGVQATLMDEVCGWVVFRKLDTAAVTGRMELRYRHPVATTSPYLVMRGRLESFSHNVAKVHSELRDADGQLCIECTCTYFAFPHEKAAQEMQFRSTETTGEDLTLEEVIDRTVAAKRYRSVIPGAVSLG